MNIADKIAKKRRENNLTQDGLASLLGVSRQAVSRWESGLAYPETDKLIKLSRIFNCTLDWLLKDDADEQTRTPEVPSVNSDNVSPENARAVDSEIQPENKEKSEGDASGLKNILAIVAACVAMTGVLLIFILNFFTGMTLSISVEGTVEDISVFRFTGSNLYYFFYDAYVDMAALCEDLQNTNAFYVVSLFLKCALGTVNSVCLLAGVTALSVVCVVKFIKYMRGNRDVRFGKWAFITYLVYLCGVFAYSSCNTYNIGLVANSGSLTISSSLNGVTIAGIICGAAAMIGYVLIQIILNARKIFRKKNIPQFVLSVMGIALLIANFVVVATPMGKISYSDSYGQWTETFSFLDFSVAHAENWIWIIQVPTEALISQVIVFAIMGLGAALIYVFIKNVCSGKQRSGLVLASLIMAASIAGVFYTSIAVGLIRPYNAEENLTRNIVNLCLSLGILIISVVLAVLNKKSRKIEESNL